MILLLEPTAIALVESKVIVPVTEITPDLAASVPSSVTKLLSVVVAVPKLTVIWSDEFGSNVSAVVDKMY